MADKVQEPYIRYVVDGKTVATLTNNSLKNSPRTLARHVSNFFKFKKGEGLIYPTDDGPWYMSDPIENVEPSEGLFRCHMKGGQVIEIFFNLDNLEKKVGLEVNADLHSPALYFGPPGSSVYNLAPATVPGETAAN